MKFCYKFAIRLVLSLVFAFIVSSMFFHGTTIVKVCGLAAILLSLAYIFEYSRKEDDK